MKKVALGIIVTLLIVLPTTLHAQTLGGRGFSKGGSGKSVFRGVTGRGKISGFRGGFSNGFMTSNSLGTRSKTRNSLGFSRSNFNKRGFRRSFSNKPKVASFNSAAGIKGNRHFINNSVSNRRLPGIRLPRGLVVKSVKTEPKSFRGDLNSNTNNFRSNSLMSRIKAKEGRNIGSREDIFSKIRRRANSFTGSSNNSQLGSRVVNLNTFSNNRTFNNRNINHSRNSSINRLISKNDSGISQENPTLTTSRKVNIAHSFDNDVMRFTKSVSSPFKEANNVNVVNNNKSFPISREINVNRKLASSRSLTNSVSRASRDNLRLSNKRNFNSINSDNGFVVHNNNHHHHHASNDNDFVFSFNFFFGNPFFFPQPVFFPTFINPFVFNPFIPPPLFPTTTFIPFPLIQPIIFQPIFVSPVFISPFFTPFPFSTFLFVDAFAVNDVIID